VVAMTAYEGDHEGRPYNSRFVVVTVYKLT
jgi:hypothetical protein